MGVPRRLLGAVHRPGTIAFPCEQARAVLTVHDPWTTLGVHVAANEEEIKKAHRRLVRQLHPDLHTDQDQKERVTAQFISVQQAYEMVMGRVLGRSTAPSTQFEGWNFHDW